MRTCDIYINLMDNKRVEDQNGAKTWIGKMSGICEFFSLFNAVTCTIFYFQ